MSDEIIYEKHFNWEEEAEEAEYDSELEKEIEEFEARFDIQEAIKCYSRAPYAKIPGREKVGKKFAAMAALFSEHFGMDVEVRKSESEYLAQIDIPECTYDDTFCKELAQLLQMVDDCGVILDPERPYLTLELSVDIQRKVFEK